MTKLHSIARATAALGLLGAATTGAQAATYAFSGQFNVDNDRAIFQFEVSTTSFVSFRTWGYGGTGTTDDGGTPLDTSDDVTTPGPLAVDYLDGVAATEASIDSGNFDGFLTLFEDAGASPATFVASNDNTTWHNPAAGAPSVLNPLEVATAATDLAGEPGYQRRQDSEILYVLDPGIYYLVLTQWSNAYAGDDTADTADDGVFGAFTYDDYENYTNDNENPDRATGCTTGYFCDVIAYDATNGYNREAQYLVELSGVDSAMLVYTPPAITSEVPLPAAAPMLAAGLAGLGLLGARRKARKG